jgi:hypothetical protein
MHAPAKGSPFKAFEKADTISLAATSLLRTITRERTRSNQAHPMLTSDTLVSLRRFCWHTVKEPSRLNLYGLAGREGGTIESVKSHFYKLSRGLTNYLTFETPMMLGILHIFTIRGWATLLCHIGILAWCLGVGRKFTKHF